MNEYRFPRTFLGWRRLFWIALRRCPKCHRPLRQDWPIYDDGETLYCLPCGGLILPRGVRNALRWNAASRKPEVPA